MILFIFYRKIKSKLDTEKVPYESDCLDSKIGYPDSWSDLPYWAQDSAENLHREGRKFLLVNYPFQTPSSSIETIMKVNKIYLSCFNYFFMYYMEASVPK